MIVLLDNVLQAYNDPTLLFFHYMMYVSHQINNFQLLSTTDTTIQQYLTSLRVTGDYLSGKYGPRDFRSIIWKGKRFGPAFGANNEKLDDYIGHLTHSQYLTLQNNTTNSSSSNSSNYLSRSSSFTQPKFNSDIIPLINAPISDKERLLKIWDILNEAKRHFKLPHEIGVDPVRRLIRTLKSAIKHIPKLEHEDNQKNPYWVCDYFLMTEDQEKNVHNLIDKMKSENIPLPLVSISNLIVEFQNDLITIKCSRFLKDSTPVSEFARYCFLVRHSIFSLKNGSRKDLIIFWDAVWKEWLNSSEEERSKKMLSCGGVQRSWADDDELRLFVASSEGSEDEGSWFIDESFSKSFTGTSQDGGLELIKESESEDTFVNGDEEPTKLITDRVLSDTPPLDSGTPESECNEQLVDDLSAVEIENNDGNHTIENGSNLVENMNNDSLADQTQTSIIAFRSNDNEDAEKTFEADVLNNDVLISDNDSEPRSFNMSGEQPTSKSSVEDYDNVNKINDGNDENNHEKAFESVLIDDILNTDNVLTTENTSAKTEKLDGTTTFETQDLSEPSYTPIVESAYEEHNTPTEGINKSKQELDKSALTDIDKEISGNIETNEIQKFGNTNDIIHQSQIDKSITENIDEAKNEEAIQSVELPEETINESSEEIKEGDKLLQNEIQTIPSNPNTYGSEEESQTPETTDDFAEQPISFDDVDVELYKQPGALTALLDMSSASSSVEHSDLESDESISRVKSIELPDKIEMFEKLSGHKPLPRHLHRVLSNDDQLSDKSDTEKDVKSILKPVTYHRAENGVVLQLREFIENKPELISLKKIEDFNRDAKQNDENVSLNMKIRTNVRKGRSISEIFAALLDDNMKDLSLSAEYKNKIVRPQDLYNRIKLDTDKPWETLSRRTREKYYGAFLRKYDEALNRPENCSVGIIDIFEIVKVCVAFNDVKHNIVRYAIDIVENQENYISKTGNNESPGSESDSINTNDKVSDSQLTTSVSMQRGSSSKNLNSMRGLNMSRHSSSISMLLPQFIIDEINEANETSEGGKNIN